MTGARSHSVVFKHRGLKMLGVLNLPGGLGRRHPGVLFLHGFPGAEKNVDVQRSLLEKGIASFALHFSGAWGSEGFYSFTGLPSQAAAGLRYLASVPSLDPRRLGVFGFSMGGWAAVRLAAREPSLRCVAAVAPVAGPEVLSSGTKEFIRGGSKPLRIRSVESLHRDFVAAINSGDAARAVERVRFPLLLIHSKTDDIVPFLCSQRIHAAARCRKELIAPSGPGHDFLDRRAWLARTAADWLTRNLRAR